MQEREERWRTSVGFFLLTGGGAEECADVSVASQNVSFQAGPIGTMPSCQPFSLVEQDGEKALSGLHGSHRLMILPGVHSGDGLFQPQVNKNQTFFGPAILR